MGKWLESSLRCLAVTRRDALSEAALSEKDEDGEGEVVIVCGTVFMMVDARQELGFDEPQVRPS